MSPLESHMDNAAQLPSIREVSQSARPTTEIRDRLSIFRLLVIVTTVAVSFAIYMPDASQSDFLEFYSWLDFAVILMIGLSLAGPLFALARRRVHRLGSGGLLSLALGVPCWVYLLPTIWDSHVTPGNWSAWSPFLYEGLPAMSFWYLLAMALGGRISLKSFSSSIPWAERYGLYLALLWLPIWAWNVWIYFSAEEILGFGNPGYSPHGGF